MTADIDISLGDGSGVLVATPLTGGRHSLRLNLRRPIAVPRREWTTRYPISLVHEIAQVKGAWTCDEIMREEDPGYVENQWAHAVLSYLDREEFRDARILDFGSGSGASTLVMTRLLPPCRITGVELDDRLLRIARLRAEFYKADNVTFLRSPSADSFPPDLDQFDFVMLNAVFEHLMPAERAPLMTQLWAHLKPGGVLFLNQTPHRWSPYENHTTKLPFINYLPDGMALIAARLFSKSVSHDADWNSLLRAGIRGSSVREVLSILRANGKAELLEPQSNVGDRIDLWYKSLSAKHGAFKRAIWTALKMLKLATRAEVVPDLALAIRKI